MTTRTAWFCPACEKHHAPHCDTCPGPATAAPLPGYTTPYIPPLYQPPTRWDQTPRPFWETPVICGTATGIADDPNVLCWN